MIDLWCQYCNAIVQPEHVTYEETHDPRSGGCGGVLTGGQSAPTGELVARITELETELARERERAAELEAALKLAQQACRAVANYHGSMEFLGTQIYDRCYDVGRTADTTGGEG